MIFYESYVFVLDLVDDIVNGCSLMNWCVEIFWIGYVVQLECQVMSLCVMMVDYVCVVRVWELIGECWEIVLISVN